MPQAWMKRSSERQRFFERAQSRLFHFEDEYGRKEVDDELFLICLAYLQGKWEKKGMPAHDFFSEFLSELEKFSRHPAETKEMVAQLLDWVTQSIIMGFHHELGDAERTDPMTIFRAPSAITEVPLE